MKADAVAFKAKETNQDAKDLDEKVERGGAEINCICDLCCKSRGRMAFCCILLLLVIIIALLLYLFAFSDSGSGSGGETQ